MARLISGLLIAAALWACSSEKQPRDQRQLVEERKALELQRQQLKDLQATIEAEKRSGLKVSLPSGEAQDIDVTHVSLVVVLPASGNAIISGRAMSDTELDDVFRAAFARDKTTQVVIQADQSVAHGRVVSIMEKAKTAGLTRLAIGTTPHER